MARPFRFSTDRKIINRIIMGMLKIGFAPRNYYLLTVPGRKTGKLYTVPVVLVENGNKRWLVAPYGEVDWVKNARASGKVKVFRGKHSKDLSIREITPKEAAPVLKRYLKENPIMKQYFDAQADSAVEEFVDEARTRPIFELTAAKVGTDKS